MRSPGAGAAISRALFWLALLATFLISLAPAQHLPSIGAFNWWDKAQHALAFAGLSFLGLRGYPQHQLIVICGLLVLGAAIEVLQGLSGWRYMEFADWIADAVGVAAGWLLFQTEKWLRR